jgi:hypothetical protein
MAQSDIISRFAANQGSVLEQIREGIECNQLASDKPTGKTPRKRSYMWV